MNPDHLEEVRYMYLGEAGTTIYTSSTSVAEAGARIFSWRWSRLVLRILDLYYVRKTFQLHEQS